jgi:hypothetical protein
MLCNWCLVYVGKEMQVISVQQQLKIEAFHPIPLQYLGYLLDWEFLSKPILHPPDSLKQQGGQRVTLFDPTSALKRLTEELMCYINLSR